MLPVLAQWAHSRQHATTRKHTAYTSSKLPVLRKKLNVFTVGVTHISWYYTGKVCGTSSRSEDKRSERAVNCNKVDSWTAGSMLQSHRLCLCASTHACRRLASEDNVLLCVQKLNQKLFTQTDIWARPWVNAWISEVSASIKFLFLVCREQKSAVWKALTTIKSNYILRLSELSGTHFCAHNILAPYHYDPIRVRNLTWQSQVKISI